MRWRTVGRVAGTVLVALAVPGAVAAAGIAGARGEVYTAREPGAPSAPVDDVAAPTHDPGKPTAVILLGSEGANAADVLAPYEVLAATEAFNLYTVAPQRQPVPLTGNLDLVPDLSLGQLDQRLPTGPEVIGLPRNYPQVGWQDGVTYVDDGDVISTARVLSGVDGALRVIERMVGPAAAAKAARAVAWPAYHPGGPAAIRQSRPAPADVVGLLSAGYRWDRPSTGVLLTDGVGEIELASAFRPYTELSYLARPVAMTTDGRPVRSRHGLTFVPRADLASAAPGLDRLVVPGADAARRAVADGLSLPERLTPRYLHDQPGFAFDAAVGDIARTQDVATARWVAKTLQYPTTNPELSGPAWPWALTLRPILLAAAAVAAVLGIQIVRRRRSAPGGDHATTH